MIAMLRFLAFALEASGHYRVLRRPVPQQRFNKDTPRNPFIGVVLDGGSSTNSGRSRKSPGSPFTALNSPVSNISRREDTRNADEVLDFEHQLLRIRSPSSRQCQRQALVPCCKSPRTDQADLGWREGRLFFFEDLIFASAGGTLNPPHPKTHTPYAA
jgi:hypothetical protein